MPDTYNERSTSNGPCKAKVSLWCHYILSCHPAQTWTLPVEHLANLQFGPGDNSFSVQRVDKVIGIVHRHPLSVAMYVANP